MICVIFLTRSHIRIQVLSIEVVVQVAQLCTLLGSFTCRATVVRRLVLDSKLLGVLGEDSKAGDRREFHTLLFSPLQCTVISCSLGHLR